MTSTAQIEANRKNAQKSTGPKSPQGKAIVAQNAITHGLTASKFTIPGEDDQRFDNHCAAILADLEPAGPMETMLAERIAKLSWNLDRINNLQSAAIHTLADKTQRANITTSIFHEVQPLSIEDGTLLGKLAVKDFANDHVLERLLMYERRLESSLYKTHLEFQKLQLLRLRKESILEGESQDA